MLSIWTASFRDRQNLNPLAKCDFPTYHRSICQCSLVTFDPSLYPSACVLDLPDNWVNAQIFEQALLRCGDALATPFSSVVIRSPAGCKLMIDVVIRLLSFCNQVIAMTKRLRLEFAAGELGIMGYLSRMGFFDHLAREADLLSVLWRTAAVHVRLRKRGSGMSPKYERNVVPHLACMSSSA